MYPNEFKAIKIIIHAEFKESKDIVVQYFKNFNSVYCNFGFIFN